MKMRRTQLLFGMILIMVLSMSLSSALTVTTSPSSITQTLNQGQSLTVPVSYTISNSENITRTAILNLGNFPNGFVTSTFTTIDVSPNDQVSGVINLNLSASSTVTPNTYTGNIFLASQSIPISLTVQQTQPTGVCKIYTLPIPLSKSLEAGSTASASLDVYVSKYCSSALTITTNQPQQQKPIKFDSVVGQVEPSQKFTIPISYDTRDVQRGTYTDSIIISGVDDNEVQYTLTIPISVTVTNSISPVTNSSFANLPTCSVSGTDLNLNQTYQLVCTNVDANIEVQPLIDPIYIVGASPFVEETATTYTATIKPIQTGITTIRANFLFKGLSVGSAFSKEVRILAGNVPVGATVLVPKFYPNLYESTDGNVIVRILDNSTGAVLEDAKIYLDGALLTNNSLHLESNRNYELKADRFGYAPITQIIALNPKPINFTLSSQYNLGSSLSFTTNPENATILYDDEIITLPFVLSEVGVHKITASLLGYSSTSQNLTVVNVARILDSTATENAKVGSNVFVNVDKNNTSLRVMFKKQVASDSKIVNQTIGNSISFEASDSGVYDVFADDALLKTYTIDSRPFYKTWWFWVLIIGIVVVGIIYLVARSSSPISAPSSGMSFNMGDGG